MAGRALCLIDFLTCADILGGYYRFAAYRNDRFEIGPAIGIGYLWLNAGIRATGTIGGLSRSLDQSVSTGSITGAWFDSFEMGRSTSRRSKRRSRSTDSTPTRPSR